MTTELTLDLFSPLIGQPFALDGAPEGPGLELVEATALPAQPAAPCHTPFSLVFRAADATGLAQGMARLHHARLGPVELFLVPVGQDAAGRYFQALFN